MVAVMLLVSDLISRRLVNTSPISLAAYDVFDGDRDVGRIYRANAHEELWFWGVSFDITRRKSYGYALSLDEAKAAFRAEYPAWKGTRFRLQGTRKIALALP